MKKLLLLILPFFILSCGTDSDVPDEDVFEPFTIGSFNVTSPTEAEYIGMENAKAKTDSTVIDSIGDYDLTIWKDSLRDRGTFQLRFVDSTFTAIDSLDLSDYSYRLFTSQENNFTYTSGGVSHTVTDEYSRMERPVVYSGCDSEADTDTDIIIRLSNGNTDSLLKHYLIKTAGLEPVIREIAC